MLFLPVLFCAIAAIVGAADPKDDPQRAKDTYPLGVQLQVLAQDLKSKDYQDVLETMIPTDLAAEWRRVATPDNYLTFADRHGGREKVLADVKLRSAFEIRRDVAVKFLELMQKAYAKRSVKPPFDEKTAQQLCAAALESAAGKATHAATAIRLVMPASGAQNHWPRFRGPTGQGDAEGNFPFTWSADENVMWKQELPGLGASSPVLWGDRLLLTVASNDGRRRELVCYDRNDGSLRWRKAAPAPKSVEKLYWKNTYASSTPVTDGERVVVFFGDGGLVCFDMEGKIVWSRDLGPFRITHGPAASPILYKEKVIFLQDQNRGESVFAAFDKRTGEELWRRKRGKAMGWSTPIVVRVEDHDELLFNGSHYIAGYDPETGEEIWRAAGSSREAIPTLVVGNGLIFSVSGRNGPMIAIRPGGKGDVTDSHIVWTSEHGGPHVPSPAYHDGMLFMVNDSGVASCIDARLGKVLWQKRLRGRFSMSPVASGGRLLVTNERGRTYILQASAQFQQLAVNDLGETTLATPAVLGGRIYLRTDKHIYCIANSQTQ